MSQWALVVQMAALAGAVGACSTDGSTAAQEGVTPAASAPAQGAQDKVTVIPALGARVRKLDNEVIDVACGVCIYGMKGGDDCPIAAEIGGKQYYFVTLKLMDEFDTHGVGLCDAAAKAKVTGEVYENGVVLTAIELIPEK